MQTMKKSIKTNIRYMWIHSLLFLWHRKSAPQFYLYVLYGQMLTVVMLFTGDRMSRLFTFYVYNNRGNNSFIVDAEIPELALRYRGDWTRFSSPAIPRPDNHHIVLHYRDFFYYKGQPLMGVNLRVCKCWSADGTNYPDPLQALVCPRSSVQTFIEN